MKLCVQGWLVLGWPLGLLCSFCMSLKDDQCGRDHLNHSWKWNHSQRKGFTFGGGGGWIGAGWGGVKLLLIGLSCRSRWSAGSWFSCACGPLFSESYISYFYDHFLYCICVFFRLVCSLCWHLWVLINGWEVSSKTSMRSRKEHLLIHNILSFNSVLIWLTRSWNYLNAQASRNPFVSPSSPCMEFLTKTVFQV